MSASILLIEDSPTDAAILIAAFEGVGYAGNIQIAQNGLDALAILDNIEASGQQNWPQLILLDLNLPRRNGLEILTDIKSNPAWLSIPTVILSSSSSPSDINSSYQLHANAYISKPRQLEHYEQVAERIYSFWIQTAERPRA